MTRLTEHDAGILTTLCTKEKFQATQLVVVKVLAIGLLNRSMF